MWRSGEISLAYLTVDGATAVQHAEAAGRAGFDAAGLRILPPTHLRGQSSVVGDPDAVRLLGDACKRVGVRPLDAEVMSLTPETERDGLVAMADTAAELGFRFVQTVVEDVDRRRAADNLARLAEAASAAGVGVALEFMAFRPLKSLDAATRLIDRAGVDNVGLVIDALHLDRAGGTVADVAALPDGCVALVQLCDAAAAPPPFESLAAEARERRLHPGEGGLPLNALLDAVPDGLPLSLEVPHPQFPGLPFEERATRTMAALRAFLDARERRAVQ